MQSMMKMRFWYDDEDESALNIFTFICVSALGRQLSGITMSGGLR